MNRNSENILLIQPKVPAYRFEIFKTLAEETNGLTVLHFGKKKVFEDVKEIQEVIGDIIEFKNLKYIKNLNNNIKSFDIVITLFDFHWINAFIIPFLNTPNKVIVWGHGLGKNTWINKLRKIGYKKADAIITYNESGKNKIGNLGIQKNKIFVANNTIKVLNAKDTSSESQKVFLYVGRLQERKKLSIFIRIFASLELYKDGYKFYILGDGEEEKLSLQNEVKLNNMEDHISFFDGTSDDDILGAFFSQAIAYISPGAVGLGVLHSFAYGVPVLTIKDVNHGPEVYNIINGENGYLFENQSLFKDFFRNENFEEELLNMGRNGYEHYSNKRKVSDMINGFKNAINYIN